MVLDVQVSRKGSSSVQMIIISQLFPSSQALELVAVKLICISSLAHITMALDCDALVSIHPSAALFIQIICKFLMISKWIPFADNRERLA